MIEPSMAISPSDTVSSPAMMLSRVDLPQPDGPTSTRKPPWSTARLMSLRTSTWPKRLLRDLISRNAMASPLDRAGHQPAHEIAAGHDVDDQGRQRSVDRTGEVHVVFLHPGRRVHQVVERHGHRQRVEAGERGAEQEIVPDVGELTDHRDHDDRPGARQ